MISVSVLFVFNLTAPPVISRIVSAAASPNPVSAPKLIPVLLASLSSLASINFV